ncbi:YebC/PmpR family DNA-binding transcriptional regulator, partial [Candidatus Poribacteria bacterium]|nr:YebC/PmpR family DNA-binding transcriptional regulator [Candidatus Poribacteria bacterium]
MSGHSKWHSIKHKKAAVDAKRGKMFTKVIKELQIAARMGGSDPDANPRLRTAIQSAKDGNMPKDTMERAIKKGAGEVEGTAFEQLTYEGYAPAGVAVMVEITTDNKNRAAAEVRHIFSKCGGNLGQTGCVSYLFERKGIIEAEHASDDEVMEAALEAGADDIESEEGFHEIKTHADDVQTVRETLEAKGIKVTSSGVKRVPTTRVHLDAKEAQSVLKLINMLEENDDVDEVYSNHEISDEVAAELE